MKNRTAVPSLLPTVEETYSRTPEPLLEARIRQRAYELYLERGGIDGNDVNDWLQAEAEILEPKEKAAAA